jgi:hypothetical protein
MYVAVLMTATIVAVIGISALTITRVELRSGEGTKDMIEARFYAQSAVEMGAFSINDDPTWRTTYSNDTWVAEQPIGNGTYTWKLVDEQDADLGNDPSQPVRLYGKGTAGDAVRIYSMLVDTEVDTPNLVRNPGMEGGTTGWSGHDCTVAQYTLSAHSGSKSLEAKNRVDYWAGPCQDITSAVEIGTTYQIEAWVKMSSGPCQARIVMWVGSEWPWEGLDGEWLTGPDVWVNDSGWTELTATLTPTWSGSLNAAYVKVDTAWGNTIFYLDDVVLIEEVGVQPLVPLAGSWRREVLP